MSTPKYHADADPKPGPQPIVLATQNPGKIAELRDLFHTADLADRYTILALADCGGPYPEPEEGRDSFLDNATLKAVTYAGLTGHWCLADDSGLEVDALQGAPGVISSHYYSNGEERGDPRDIRDPANNAKLLADLAGVEPSRRAARFVCTMVLANPTGHTLAVARGEFEGRIGTPEHDQVPRGTHGFGYDPLFMVPPEYAISSAELDPAAKNARSHRGHALRSLIEQLRTLRG